MASQRDQKKTTHSPLGAETQKWIEALRLFPYEQLRPYQPEFLKAIARYRRVIAQAPTGAGKTIMALAALLPSADADRGIQLIIFTRTKSQVFTAHFRELARLSHSRVAKGGRMIRVVPLIAKADLCVSPDRQRLGRRLYCSAQNCPPFKQAKVLDDRRFSELYRLFLQQATKLSPSRLVELLNPLGCPYQIIRRLCPTADVIVTTHAYLTGEGLRTQLRANLHRQTFVSKFALIDEVHNLSHRVTASLSRTTLEQARDISPELRVFQQLISVLSQQPEGEVRPPLDLQAAPLFIFCDQNSAVAHADHYTPLFKVADFLESEGDVWLSEGGELLKLDPFPAKTFAALDEFAKVIVQSGTLYPVGSYCKYFEIDSRSRKGRGHYVPFTMPAVKSNELNAILDHALYTSSYKRRTPRTPLLMAETIAKLHACNPGHTFIFAPSHAFKTAIANRLTTPYVEKRGPGHYPTWLDEVRELPHELILGVMGGRLSEGVEILDPTSGRSRISMVCIAGLSYMKPDLMSAVLEKLHVKRYGRMLAREFLLEMPMRRQVLQAIGRGIRSDRDFCAGIILDYRARFGSWVPNAHIYRFPDALIKGIMDFYRKFRR
ncbi:MAG: helicase C-terminal domain-containing protein [Candidatus Heimdallarchaeota archaeon]